MMATTFSQLPGSGYSSRVAVQSHILRCLDLILEGLLVQCSRKHRIAS